MPDRFEKQPLDFSYLIDMVGNEPAFLIELIDTFLVQIPVFITEIDAAVIACDRVKISNYAHKIKPTFSYIGRNDIKNFVHQIENEVKNTFSLEKTALDVEKLKIMLEYVLLQLEKEKSKLVAKL